LPWFGRTGRSAVAWTACRIGSDRRPRVGLLEAAIGRLTGSGGLAKFDGPWWRWPPGPSPQGGGWPGRRYGRWLRRIFDIVDVGRDARTAVPERPCDARRPGRLAEVSWIAGVLAIGAERSPGIDERSTCASDVTCERGTLGTRFLSDGDPGGSGEVNLRV